MSLRPDLSPKIRRKRQKPSESQGGSEIRGGATTSEAADDGEERKNQPASWKSKLSPLNSYRLLFLLQKQKPV